MKDIRALECRINKNAKHNAKNMAECTKVMIEISRIMRYNKDV